MRGGKILQQFETFTNMFTNVYIHPEFTDSIHIFSGLTLIVGKTIEFFRFWSVHLSNL